MRNFTKGLLGAMAAAGVMASAPAYAGMSTAVQAPGYHASEQTSDFYKKRKHRDRNYYARDQRVNSNTRVWRDNDGRYRCKKDNGTTGLLIGGAVGGVAGHEIAGGGDKLLGTVLGAAGGALLGREIDKSKYRCR
ncbi:glycine zipper 2TM domain-containing protein [Sphingopyxis panaciterrae]